jgi:FtsH-binding integral membrane protein
MTDHYPQARAARPTEVQVDQGLRSYMLRVYNYMAVALTLTGLTAYVTAHLGIAEAIFTSGIGWLVIFAPLGFIFVLTFGVQRMKAGTVQALFWVFSVLMGISISYIFLVYTQTSIVRTFFITAAMFGAMSLYGYTTKRSLARWGSFLFMGLIGIIIAMVVNWFLHSTMLHFIISGVGVVVFTGLTAYDTQRIKESYVESDGKAVLCKKAIYGALSLYLDFINLFLIMLRLFGGRN